MADQPRLPHVVSETPAAYDAEKESFRERLRQALRDPAFRAIEGFPVGKDEDILALSDPPYYTACPNPFLREIIAKWQAERAQLRADLGLPDDSAENGNGAPPVYHCEPFAADVSEGKNDPIYNAHSYHTKVPHKAIMRYILHYTDPGDIVLDGFCGTGMTGVAAQLCADRKAVEGLGYRVDRRGMVRTAARSESPDVRDDSHANGRASPRVEEAFTRLGARRAILVDLSPAATFIAYNYNSPVDPLAFERTTKRILREVQAECGWMYETWHPHCDDPQRARGCIDHTVWSDVFICPECGREIVFGEAAVDHGAATLRDSLSCPGCGALNQKGNLERAWEIVFDRRSGATARRPKQVPTVIQYSLGKAHRRKAPDREDLRVVRRIEEEDIPDWFPTDRMMFKGKRWGDMWRPYHGETERPIDFLTHRNLRALARVEAALDASNLRSSLQQVFIDILKLVSRMRMPGAGQPPQNMYLPSLSVETNVFATYTRKVAALLKIRELWRPGEFGRLIATGSSSSLSDLANESIDYVFVDPPFGGNIIYSELSFFFEVWLRAFTNNGPEAIVSKAQHKGLPDYQRLMQACFREFHRVLRPGRWVTVVFHNSRNAVWNAIQEATLRAGFVVADVRTLDKKQGTFKQQTTTGAVKQDLVISAYKPRASFEQLFEALAGSADGAWSFVRQHLAQLPVVVETGEKVEVVAERQAYLLYDRMVAFHIQRGATVPLSAAEFYAGLRERFVERDGMFFLPDQVPHYDRARLKGQPVAQLALFVSDEKSAIQWLRQQLDAATGGQPQTYQDLQPHFLRQLHQARHEALPELQLVLEQSFLQDGQGRWYVPDANRAGDLEKLRQKALLHEFTECAQGQGRLRQFRTEAVHAGFADAWRRRDYATILTVAERLPESVLQEDQELLMYYDNASLRNPSP